ncbi:MAG TPA: hypothetical protein VH083_21550 [Myxococcales bacterium]|nr:hypothetical protein [Myxococcales bacterium]
MALLKFCFIGGLAVQRWGEPRMTRDIVHKVFAGRPKDWEDVRGVVDRQPVLDTSLIWDELLPLLELREDITSEARLRELLAR